MKSQKEYVPNVIHDNVVLRALGGAQKWDELRLCWIEMAKDAVLPTNNTYSMLVDVYGKAGLVKEAVLWIKHIRARGMYPDEVTMSTVLKVLMENLIEQISFSMESIEVGSVCFAVSFKHFLSTELFKTGGRIHRSKVREADLSGERKPRLTATFNTLIDLYRKAGRLKDAADVFAEMLKSGVAVDTITFNTMIYTCGLHGHLAEAEALLGKMEERGISPDTKTYNILLSLYADVGDIDAALNYYRKIREVDLFPDIVTFRAVLHILCERIMVQDVEAVIEDIEKSGACMDEHSVPAIVKMYVDEGLVELAKILYGKCQLDGD
ncbi:Pentatricopeptide repeat [Dillenia turbinata]|uniref:Pentatricopeptide repeat n=1 Tax=Dillenia turbinata TaxID=194707 RepID=A0AAN8UQ39_9MAGN